MSAYSSNFIYILCHASAQLIMFNHYQLWDIRVKEQPVACMEPIEGGPRRDCWSVAFGSSSNPTDRMVRATNLKQSYCLARKLQLYIILNPQPLNIYNLLQVAAGFDNGDVKIFDLRTMTLHWETRVPNGVCSVAFDR